MTSLFCNDSHTEETTYTTRMMKEGGGVREMSSLMTERETGMASASAFASEPSQGKANGKGISSK